MSSRQVKKNNFLVNSIQKSITVFEYPSRKIITAFKLFGSSSSILMVSNNEKLIIGYDDGISSIIIWSIKSKKEIDSFRVDSMSSYDSFLAINRDDSVLAIANSNKIKLYSLVEKKWLLTLSPWKDVHSAIFIPDSPYLVVSVGYGDLIILDIVAQEYIKVEINYPASKLLYLESSKEIIGLQHYDYKYMVLSIDDLIKIFQEKKKRAK